MANPTKGEDEDGYLAMTFAEPTAQAKETSIQRSNRLKKEAAERSRIPSKKERLEKDKAARDAALATQLDASNKGAQMLAKLGYRGGALGQTEGARTQPIELQVKGDRGGVGMDGEKKRKLREEAAKLEGLGKRRRVGEEEYRERTRGEREERHAEGLMWSAMRTLEGFETGEDRDEVGNSGEGEGQTKTTPVSAEQRPLASINILWRPLVKQRLEKERERRMRYDLEQSLSSSLDYSNPHADEDDRLAFGSEVEALHEDDAELDAFEGLSFADRLGRIVDELRGKYHYCFWCKFRYPDKTMEGCPGLTEDEHG